MIKPPIYEGQSIEFHSRWATLFALDLLGISKPTQDSIPRIETSCIYQVILHSQGAVVEIHGLFYKLKCLYMFGAYSQGTIQ